MELVLHDSVGIDRDFVPNFFTFRLDGSATDQHPAFHCQLTWLLAGSVVMTVPSGERRMAPPLSLLAPMRRSTLFEMIGPVRMFGAAVGPAGFVALTGAPLSAHVDRLLDARAIIGEALDPLTEALQRMAREGADGDAMSTVAGPMLARLLRPVPERHRAAIRRLKAALRDCSDMTVERLAQDIAYSPRQLQRLALDYFGIPVATLLRRQRALQASRVLVDPAATAAQIDRVRAMFYDQSHMIRELRSFTGRTPVELPKRSSPLERRLIEIAAPLGPGPTRQVR